MTEPRSSLLHARPPGCDCQWFENQVCDVCQGIDPENPAPDVEAGSLFSDAEIAKGVTSELSREFPMLWNLACEYDFAERLGGCTDPLRAEADAALRELWTARTNARAE
jgi:hypothetical protein